VGERAAGPAEGPVVDGPVVDGPMTIGPGGTVADTGAFDVVVSNEFARVSVSLVRHGNGKLLRIRCPRSGRTAYLDALALETLTWQTPDLYERLLAEPHGPDDH
jgi:hypothetical protein